MESSQANPTEVISDLEPKHGPEIEDKAEEAIPDKEDVNTEDEVAVVVNFEDVGFTFEESEKFFLRKTQEEIESIFKTIHEICAQILAKIEKKGDLYKVGPAVLELESVTNVVELQLPGLVEPAKLRGIVQGLNGYRSVFVLLLRVLEKTKAVIEVCPSRPKVATIIGTQFSIPGFSTEMLTNKWSFSMGELNKQLRIVGIMVTLAIKISQSTDDLFVKGTNEQEQEDAVMQLALSLPTSAFFGIHFGSQYTWSIQKILRVIMLANTAHSSTRKSGKDTHWMIRGGMSLMYGAYYNFFPSQAAEQYAGRGSIDIEELKEFWNLTENPWGEKASTIMIPVAQDFKLILPPVKFQVIGEESEMVNILPPSIPPSMLEDGQDPFLPVHVRFISYTHLKVDLLEESKELKSQKEYEDMKRDILEIPGKTKDMLKKKIGWINPEKHHEKTTEKSPMKPDDERVSRIGSIWGKKEDGVISDSLIIHFHGGGFVAQTASSHILHLREWTKDTNAPILSVDYRLAPEYPFPIQLTECYYAYMWAITNCHKLGTTAKRIVIIGDSAGGNLAAAVSLMAANQKTRIPDGLILIYPALYMHFVPSASRLLSAIDPMLHTQTLKSCFDAYLPKESDTNPRENPFLSPASASDELMRTFPDKVYIMCGTLDPLFDDSIFFAKRLVSVGKKPILKVYDSFPHGYLNLGAVPALGKEMWGSVKLCAEWMNHIFETQNKN